ncbi:MULTISPECIES: rhodanese-like domain-containing protein [unclassified Neisseria]|uniref:rhodanese-like domain-containing protein n=1 Tax=unclassified Neisseria TaxID=2623750 RepID=UPI002665E803|nr:MULTISPECIES: rhodanese-like domain-containing protein [unclassified Neisseria]MDO1509400.1 rhodanese-like domain-containing protein [Neisseria sp. MVDL19-042950]MDO1515827.1 rhodanese-like domain-containing protein [Neisseria sp. MVDL18-041461]MDO1563349.1 rhodanese-like domain-containing protein [Neisseria sp. MVDL20-010259]
MAISTITAADAANKVTRGALLIDIRRPDEYRREHIEGAVLQPLAQLQMQGLPKAATQADCLISHCKSGMRTKGAVDLLAQTTNGKETLYSGKRFGRLESRRSADANQYFATDRADAASSDCCQFVGGRYNRILRYGQIAGLYAVE